METVKSFEDLRIWQEARALVKQIYSDLRANAGADRDYGFKDQIQKSGVSIILLRLWLELMSNSPV